MGTVHRLEFKFRALLQFHWSKKQTGWYELNIYKYLIAEAARALTDEPEESASERSRENAYYERYFSFRSPAT